MATECDHARRTGKSPPARPAVFDAKQLDVPRDINGIWLLKVGDDPSFASPDLNDSNSTTYDLARIPDRMLAKGTLIPLPSGSSWWRYTSPS